MRVGLNKAERLEIRREQRGLMNAREQRQLNSPNLLWMTFPYLALSSETGSFKRSNYTTYVFAKAKFIPRCTGQRLVDAQAIISASVTPIDPPRQENRLTSTCSKMSNQQMNGEGASVMSTWGGVVESDQFNGVRLEDPFTASSRG